MRDHVAALADALRAVIRAEVLAALAGTTPASSPPRAPDPVRDAVRGFLVSLPCDGAWRPARDLHALLLASEHAISPTVRELSPMGLGRRLSRERGRLVDIDRDRTGTQLYRRRADAGAPGPA